MSSKPIGIFDSGVGGLSVWKEISNLLPYENLVYFADQKNCPYGTKTEKEILELVAKVCDFLISRECKMIIMACNTATAHAIQTLRNKFPHIPFVGMEPAVKPAIINSRTHKIGVLATQATLRSEFFKKRSSKYLHEQSQLFLQPGHGLVELVENSKASSPEAKALLESYLLPMINKGADHLVLGCSHYPFFHKIIQEIIDAHSSEMTILDPAEAIARRTKNLLLESGNLNDSPLPPFFQFFTNANIVALESFINKELVQTKNNLNSSYEIKLVADQ
ncbi:glutamate racemase [Aureibacter tunicatorum]|uniref:Glutamate racemase n=1 Tax=Aureibacter tunicatorum TaxID=866807 RepID=A0AAE4BQN5_9BACT|nr:glutamate racemase [Aureibacter tunicatorum]MDR6239334.1 glutamate racemase [Aureibacter tunicatorum]BDD04743.1 glutamate racemase [Aureibacter tunicatorum]